MSINILMENKLSKIAFGLGCTAFLVGVAVVGWKFRPMTFRGKMKQLRQKVKSGWKNNPELVQLEMLSEKTLFLPKYQSIQFYVKIISSEKFTKKSKLPQQIPIPANVDPFSAENYKGLFISELSKTHVLLYNKFHLVPYHVLIVTKKFEHQNSLLNAQDFAASLLVMKSLDGFVFFNSGPEAGASQEHKHLQAIPYSSFPNQSIPIETLIEKDEATLGNEELFTLPVFKFKHIFCKLTPSITKKLRENNVAEKGEILADAYRKCLVSLGNMDLKISYNLVLTKKWMFMVLRKTEQAMNKVKINAVGYTGSFAVRSVEEYDFILSQDPFNILTLVSFPL